MTSKKESPSKDRVGDYKIPFDDDGNMCRDGYYFPEEERHYKDNHIFEGSLKFIGYGNARSGSSYFRFKSSSGRIVYMFVSDFNDIVCRMVKGTIKGPFTYTKKNKNYGVKLIS